MAGSDDSDRPDADQPICASNHHWRLGRAGSPEGGPRADRQRKATRSQGLGGVLKELHDELDAAVLQAYCLAGPVENDALLAHLPALNAQRAAEEKTGPVRWLRPEFQNPQAAAPACLLLNQELLGQ